MIGQEEARMRVAVVPADSRRGSCGARKSNEARDMDVERRMRRRGRSWGGGMIHEICGVMRES